MDKYICIHGHFYQPPRENPWLEEVEMQDSAYPYHDWNDRITAECYGPNTASRILDGTGKIIDIVNIYSKISFNFGPTLLSWLEKHKPETYRGITEADKLSQERFSGHGSAIAQVYNHMIMPLANDPDKQTQVIWGIEDFKHRFGRMPEGIWLAETAVDITTLEILAENGIKFTILAPRQAEAVRKMVSGADWEDVSGASVDPSMAYLCPLPSGRTINLFFYDGPISQSIAFGGLLNDGKFLADKLVNAFDDSREHNQLVQIATDGETYGHHHHNGDMALAYCLYYIESEGLAKLTNYGEFLEANPPAFEARIVENSSWSCGHGVERWRENCGCNSGRQDWHQKWRKPLREALNYLREISGIIFTEQGGKYLKDPWAARNYYIRILLDRSRENVEAFMKENGKKELSQKEVSKVLKLLEMQRNAMLMYTSCGWFFDEVSGLETVQVIQYAAKVIQFAGEFSREPIEAGFIKMLKNTPSNIHENGIFIYENFVKPSMIDLLRVGAHYAISSLFEDFLDDTKIGSYTAHKEIFNKAEAGKMKLATGKMKIISEITWDEEEMNFAVLHLGDNNINCGVRKFESEEQLNIMEAEIRAAFERGDVAETIRLMNTHFEGNNYSLWHLFRDQQRKILNQIMELTYENTEASYRQIYDNNYAIMSFYQSLNIPLPKALLTAAEHILNADLKKVFEAETIDTERLAVIINDIKRWSIDVDSNTIRFIASARVNSLLEHFSVKTEAFDCLQLIENVLTLLNLLDIKLRFWKSQNTYFSITREKYSEMQQKAEDGDKEANQWINTFNTIGEYLRVDPPQVVNAVI